MKLWKNADIDIPPPWSLKVAFGMMDAGCILLVVYVFFLMFAWDLPGSPAVAIISALIWLCILVGVNFSLRGGSGRMRLLFLPWGCVGLLGLVLTGFYGELELPVFVSAVLVVLLPILLYLPPSERWFTQFAAKRYTPSTFWGRVADRFVDCLLLVISLLSVIIH